MKGEHRKANKVLRKEQMFYPGITGNALYLVTRRGDSSVVVSSLQMPQRPNKELMDIISETAKVIADATASEKTRYVEPVSNFPNLIGYWGDGRIVEANMSLMTRESGNNPSTRWVMLKAKETRGGVVYEVRGCLGDVERLEPFLVEMVERENTASIEAKAKKQEA